MSEINKDDNFEELTNKFAQLADLYKTSVAEKTALAHALNDAMNEQIKLKTHVILNEAAMKELKDKLEAKETV